MSGSEPFDSAACLAASLDDLSSDKLRRFVLAARQARGLPLSEDAPMPELLAALGFMNQGRPANAAVLLFGHAPQGPFPWAKIECSHLDEGSKAECLVCHGTVFEAVDQAMYFILSRLKLPAEAVREAVVNAVAHRDYRAAGSIDIRVFPDRLEVRNPGVLPEGVDLSQLRLEHGSMPRNPLLAEALFLAAYRATKGKGTDAMMTLCQKAGLPEPEFQQEGGFTVILRLRTAPGAAENAPPEASPMPPELLALVRVLGQAEALGNADILKLLGLTDRTFLRKRYLVPALEAGLIERTIPDAPNSRLQKYRLTAKGKALLGL